MQIPEDYKCSVCKAHGVKMWRPCGRIELFCFDCAYSDQTPYLIKSLKDSMIKGRLDLHLTDQIYGLLPAVPDLENVGEYWGYTSVPAESVEWWHSLEPKFRRKSK
jgi:hypothetical protein